MAIERAFLDAAVKRAQFLSENNAKKANREYDRIHAFKNDLRRLPDRGEAALKRMLLNGELQVKLMAAVCLLAVDEAYAVEAFREISESSVGISSLDATLTLREWHAGNLREYWG